MKTIRTNPTKITHKKFMDYVNDDIKKYDCTIVCGHTHNKVIDTNYINTGSFGQFADYVELNNGKTLLISDIHIGDVAMEYANKYSLEPILSDAKYTEIILIGDILDLWTTNPETIHLEYHWFFSLLNKLSYSKNVIYIRGNHDFELTKYNNITQYLYNIKIVDEYSCIYSEHKFRFVHGQDYDINSKPFYIKLFYYIWTPIGDNLYWVGKRLKQWALKINSKI